MLTHIRGAQLSAFLIALMLSAAAFAGGCGDDDGGGASNDPGPSQSATARAQNVPDRENGTVRSGSLGYSAEIPEDWNVLPTTELPQALQDQYVSPDSGQFPATIRVRCLKGAEATVETVLSETTRAHTDATPGPQRTVGGQEITSLRYRAGTPPIQTEHEDVVFSSSQCVWVISFVTAPDKREERIGVFERFLNTFNATQ
jgi:hypothetical protein